MSTVQTLLTATNSSEDTFELGKHLGQNLKGGETLLLNSDLGGGKTQMAKGIVAGLGSKEIVTSPTFTIEQTYKGSELTIHHFDFYRLNEGGMVARELEETVHDPKAVVLIEWGDVVEGVLPESKMVIKLERMSESENKRRISIEYPEELAYAVEGLKE